ncbi:endonuclease/exonuclease/phosphatase family protein [Acrocarpospora catenulata]|uniref:endonuclease/exonuclease/phosphatase family protein n=1 Tax=Acrocarpospora catenulata TaxID=2836182 RepID=UPI001BDA9D69|nr:endonuclease/exonuclease/phosphatase family protein [Acrocarpospora catenulata]
MADVTEVGGTVTTPEPGKRRFIWLLVVPCAVWALLRAAGIELGGLGAILSTVTPYVGLVAVVALLVAALARKWAAAVAGLVAVIALAATVLPRAVPAAQPAADGPVLRVLTLNLMIGQADTGAVLELVRRLRPDVLSLQELTPGAAARLSEGGLAELLPHQHAQPAWGASGSAVYARFPIEPLPEFAPAHGHRMPFGRIEVPGAGPVEVAAVHPVNPLRQGVPPWRKGLRSMPGPDPGAIRILVGDFNATQDHAEFRRVLDLGYVDAAAATGSGLAPTWPAMWRLLPPVITIDHVLADPRVRVLATGLHTVPGTDHRALLAELRLPEKAPNG